MSALKVFIDLLDMNRTSLTRLLSALLFLTLGAAISSRANPQPPGQDLGRFEGLRIDSIEIDNRNIYDTADASYDNFIFRMANRLHLVTRKAVIEDEILQSAGQEFSANLAEESARNMRSRLALYDAWVEARQLPGGGLLVRYITIDEWSLSGGVEYSRDGNLDRVRLGVAERNLLGRALDLEVNYHIEDGRSNFLSTGFSDRRLFGQPLGLTVSYSDNPEARRRLVGLQHPYYNLLQNWKLGFYGGTTSDLREVYIDDRLVASVDNEADRFGADAGYRFGDYIHKIELEALYDWSHEVATDRTYYSNSIHDSTVADANFPADSNYHRLGLSAGYLVHRYVRLKRLDGFGVTEDYRVGPTIELAGSYAFSHDTTAFRHIGLGLGWAHLAGRCLVALNGETLAWYDRTGGLVRRLYGLRVWFYNQSFRKTTLALSARFLQDTPRGAVNQLVLGGTTGLRGYDKYFMTGNRRLAANFEARFLPGIEILSVRFGATLFADMGQVWKSGENLDLDNTYASIGIGLRVSGEKSSRSALGRVDFSWSRRNGWQISVGSGQYFVAPGAGLPLTTY